ncbi:2-oxo-4-hydroxy-4-carboxy-5-ureidoimidazoline decarboxylase [Streptomyces sp. ACA25]|nr:2-oxo-4-hydroxy-4-carboxy-5-ureidoimidazoline decarboxylase [Streptomyces sp. ACA25]MDB1089217.1 2-oxo-4-hydroxy-4-carboxy-5-ureidoimidazoline decarboxylase [Streptomyces sp. ACA25]
MAWINDAAEDTVRRTLHEVCAAPAWGRALLAGRPYAGLQALLAAGDAATAALTPAGLDEALAGHPPIGRPRPGDRSAQEQRGMSGAPEALAEEMQTLNLAYQERFGHVFLICATGLSAGQLLEAARTRLGNPPETEREIVRTELGSIHRIRLARLSRPAGEKERCA